MTPDFTTPNNRWSARRTRRNITLLGLAGLLVLVLLGAAFMMDRRRAANRLQLERVNLAQVQLSEVFGLLRDMETAQRGYLLTGDNVFLEPYNTAVQAYPDAVAELRRLTDSTNLDMPQLSQDLVALEEAARVWRDQTTTLLAQQRPSTVNDAALRQLLASGKVLFDEIRARNATLTTDLDSQRQVLGRLQNAYNNVSLVLFVLITSTTLATLGYGMALLRRVGFLASALQGRQERQDVYTNVISTLNGPTQLVPLLHSVLPQLADSVGAHAAVVYMLEGNTLLPMHAVGLDPAALAPLGADTGLPGRVLHEERILVIDNEASDRAFHVQTGLGIAPPHGVVYLPLRYGTQSLGVLVVASLKPINPDVAQQLVLTASQLATAISTVRAFEEMQELADELAHQNERLAHSLETSETMQEIGRELVVQSDLQSVLTLVCSEARHLLRADYTAVATVCDAQGSTRWVAVDGVRSGCWQDYIFAPHRGTAGHAIDQAGPVILGQWSDHESLATEEFPLHLEEEMQSALSVPLFRKETPIGALIVAYRKVHDITPAETELAQSLAAYASIAIENARLLSELQGERDLAEQRARELAAKNKEVERANRLKSEFMANMSHELRTPLNSILALSQILLDRLDGDLNDEQQKQVHIIERNGRNLLRLINDILDLSRIEAGRVELNIKPVYVPDLLSAVRSTVAPLAAQKNIELRADLAPELPVCRTDENKLKQILLNLLSNAVKFTEHGSVTLRARHGRIGGRTADVQEWITFEVQDTGIGIAPEDQNLVWEEFRQIDGSLSRRYEGTGLGLAIVRRLVTMLGGEIVLESSPGQGSTFRFWLPTQFEAQPMPALPASPKVADDAGSAALEHTPLAITPSRPLVLIVDDDIEVIYILEKYLRDEGYQIEVAQTGDEAIAKARQLKPFAMTLDVTLPGRDGWEVMQVLKSDPATSDIPIIMISMLDNRQFGYRLGAADYLVKPVSRSELLQRLEQLRTSAQRLEMALIIDDDPTQVRVIAHTLREVGLQVAMCSSGVAALEWLDDHTPDLITLDLMMPGMDGFTVLEVLRARPHLHDVPVLIITAKDIDPEDHQRLNGSIAAIIQKGPQQRDELLHELAEHLRQHQRAADSTQHVSA